MDPLDRRLRGISKDLKIDNPHYFGSSTFNSLVCICQLPLWNFESLNHTDLSPHVPRIHDKDLLWLADL
jgi:hypothetical protein